MKLNTISKRLVFQISILLISFSAILLVANLLLLNPLYRYRVQTSMVDSAEQIKQIDFSSDSWTNDLANTSINAAYDLMITYNNNVIYSSSRRFGLKSPDRNSDLNPKQHPSDSKYFPINEVRNWKTFNMDTQYGELISRDGKVDMYVVQSDLGDGLTLVLTQGAEPIRQSVQTANLLLGIFTGLFLIIGIIVAYRMSKNFTKPIRDMKSHLHTLSKMEFGSRLLITTNDELTELSDDINTLADELQLALNRLTKQNIQLEKDIEFQRRFISNASHELRTPLALIKGYSDEIYHGFVKDGNQEKQYIGYIVEESNKMNRLLNELLELSRLESGYLEFRKENLSLSAVIHSFMEKYTGFIEEHELKVALELTHDMAYFDPMRFEQILANLISNAAKYGDEKNEIIVHIERQSNALARTIRVRVSNSGHEISDSQVTQIWSAFYKADEARTYDENSYGLGLSIVKAIQDKNGLEYGCYSEPGWVHFWFDVEAAYD